MNVLHRIIWGALIAFSLSFSATSADASGRGATIWNDYSAAQKALSLMGFLQCYTLVSSDENAFERVDTAAALRIVTEATKTDSAISVGDIMLDALNRAPRYKSEVSGEHWDGPYGFATGLWWRALFDEERGAYFQGVLWCAESNSDKVTVLQQDAIDKLNSWYLISDEDWKDPRTGVRADVAVMEVMQQLQIVRLNAKK